MKRILSRHITWHLLRNFVEKCNTPLIRTSTIYALRYNQRSLRGYEHNPDFDYHEVKTFQQFSDDKQMGCARAVTTLMKMLHITKENATKVVKEYPIFGELSRTAILENYQIMRDEDIAQSTLVSNIYVLADTTSNLKQKIMCLKKCKLDLNTAIMLFKWPIKKFLKFLMMTRTDICNVPKYNNRIEYLAARLEVDVNVMCEKFSRETYLVDIKIEKVIKITDYLLGSGMERHHLLDDLCIYRYGISRIIHRVTRAIAANKKPLRPWVVRCPIEIIENAEKRTIDRNKHLARNERLPDYIAKIINCDPALIECLIKRYPDIEKMGLKKLTSKLKFFVDFGYTGKEIFTTAYALMCNEEKMKTRYKLWQSYNLGHPRLFVIAGSQKNFNKYFKEHLELKNNDQSIGKTDDK